MLARDRSGEPEAPVDPFVRAASASSPTSERASPSRMSRGVASQDGIALFGPNGRRTPGIVEADDPPAQCGFGPQESHWLPDRRPAAHSNEHPCRPEASHRKDRAADKGLRSEGEPEREKGGGQKDRQGGRYAHESDLIPDLGRWAMPLAPGDLDRELIARCTPAEGHYLGQVDAESPIARSAAMPARIRPRRMRQGQEDVRRAEPAAEAIEVARGPSPKACLPEEEGHEGAEGDDQEAPCRPVVAHGVATREERIAARPSSRPTFGS